MKKTLFTFLMLFVLCSTVAQHRQKFGLTAGMNYSKFRGMDAPQVDYSYASSITAGLAYQYYLNENWSLKFNLFYENKKSRAKADFRIFDSPGPEPVVVTATATYSYDYITLPVVVQYDFKKFKGFFVNAGVFQGFLLDSEAKVEGNNPFYSHYTDYTTTTTDYYNKLDFGFVLGVGKVFRLSDKNSLVLEVRNSHGIFQTNKNNTYENNTVRSNSYAFLLGWSCDL